ncbi:proline transporter 2 [Prunus dulcis]|uniref:Proline transporter 2 n=1 Tax=Prunus dulcis TaxID=3755 RepID=A0A4Y1RHH3_PRUDU|nr:proline transporter 2 [Prunus dulcis]
MPTSRMNGRRRFMATSFNFGYILSFSSLMLVPLGWTWGVVCMVVEGFYSLYVNWLLAAFHFINGQRFIRYRDTEKCLSTNYMQKNVLLHLGFTICDPPSRKYGFHSPWWKSTEVCSNSICCVCVSAIRALKWWRMFKGYVPLQTGNQLRIQSLSIEAPMVHRYHRSDVLHIFFFIPTISAMRGWLEASTIVTFAYIVTLLVVVVVKDGTQKTSVFPFLLFSTLS